MQTGVEAFPFPGQQFLRILEDGKSTAAYVTTDQTSGCDEALSHLVAHLKYGSIIDLLLRRFWWAVDEKGLEGLSLHDVHECSWTRSSSGIHAPFANRPVPPVALTL
ncbi:hypothetical protein BASA81_005688 [Batrachochytrium salamandrivorans]|nr:hypothetical protein BASA81_005688 [Batrachochytrium salamandrivorans]